MRVPLLRKKIYLIITLNLKNCLIPCTFSNVYFWIWNYYASSVDRIFNVGKHLTSHDTV
jgi:hypothetical protein